MKEWLACLLCSRQYSKTKCQEGFPGGSDVSACNAGDPGSITGLRRSPGGGNGKPLEYFCLENPMDVFLGQRSLKGYRPWGRIVRHN